MHYSFHVLFYTSFYFFVRLISFRIHALRVPFKRDGTYVQWEVRAVNVRAVPAGVSYRRHGQVVLRRAKKRTMF